MNVQIAEAMNKAKDDADRYGILAGFASCNRALLEKGPRKNWWTPCISPALRSTVGVPSRWFERRPPSRWTRRPKPERDVLQPVPSQNLSPFRPPVATPVI